MKVVLVSMMLLLGLVLWNVVGRGHAASLCTMPNLSIPKRTACALGRSYPDCKWQIPSERSAGGLYRIWDRTPPDERWGSPTLVKLALGAAYGYLRTYPGELLTIGDLDAPPEQHQTHDRGMDMDLYLPGRMLEDNESGANYREISHFEQRMLRARVFDLAKILARCAQGRIRIYYNDAVVQQWFNPWFWARGWRPPFGAPMVAHNASHRYHMHVTVLRPMAGGQ